MLLKLYTYLESTYNVYHSSHIDAMFVISLSYICPIKMHYCKKNCNVQNGNVGKTSFVHVSQIKETPG